MPGGSVVDVAIALVLLFYLGAVANSAFTEWLSNLMKKRAKYLLRGLQELLHETRPAAQASAVAEQKLYNHSLAVSRDDETPTSLAATVINHPLIKTLQQQTATGKTTRLPSYLSAATFARVLVDILVPDPQDRISPDKLRAELEDLKPESLGRALNSLFDDTVNNVSDFRQAVETWYDEQMDRISGAYKRWARRWMVVIGLALAAVLHLDAIGVANHVWTDEPARNAIAAQVAGSQLCEEETEPAARRECLSDQIDALVEARLPIGPQAWADRPDGVVPWLSLLLGLVITGLATMLGAPFWFDALGRLNSLRNTGPKPPKSQD